MERHRHEAINILNMYIIWYVRKCYRKQKNSSKGDGEGQVAVFRRVVRVSLTEKASCEQRPEGSEK